MEEEMTLEQRQAIAMANARARAAAAVPPAPLDYPEGDSRNGPAAITVGGAPEPDGAVATAARGGAQGLTFNLADEIFAGMNAVAQPFTGKGSDARTLAERYGQNLDFERDRFRRDAEANPVADITGNIVGTLVGPAKFAKAAKTIGGLAREGIKAGLAYGFGAGEGGLDERAASAVEGGGIGALTGGGLGVLGKGFEAVRPANLMARYVNKAYDAPMVPDSAAAMHEVGQLYTPGQATGSRGMLTIEGMLRRHPVTADKMAEFDQKQVENSLSYLDKTLSGISVNRSSPDIVGDRVGKAFDDVVNKAVTARRSVAKRDFDLVDELAGNYRVFKPQNLFGEIDELTSQFAVPGGGDASSSLVKQMQGIKNDIMERAGPEGLKAKEVQRLLEVYGKAAAGKGAVFKDLETGQQRMLAGKLRDAVLRDVDAAADNSTHQGLIADALKTARDNYRKNSGAINSLEESALGRLLGGPYERVPEKIAQSVSTMKPSQIKATFAILNKSDPQVSQAVKRHMIEEAMAKAGRTNSAAPQAQVAGEDVFSAAKFLTAMRKSEVWNVLTPTEKKRMTMTVRDLERTAFRSGTDGSPTTPLRQAQEIFSRPIGQVGGGAGLGAGVSLFTGGDWKEGAMYGASAGAAPGIAYPRLVRQITTPEGQAALSTLRRMQPGSGKYRLGTGALTSALIDAKSE